MYDFGSYAGYPYFPQPPKPGTGIIPHQQVIQVNGKSSVDTIQLAPNSSILVMDTTAPIVWMCVSDGVGKVTSTPYDISEHKELPPVDTRGIEERLSKVEATVNSIMEAITNGSKSNVRNAEQKSANAEHRAN